MPKRNSTPAPAPEQVDVPATAKVAKVRTPEEKRASALQAVATRRAQPGGLSASANKAIATRTNGKGASGHTLQQSARLAWSGENGVKRRANLERIKAERAAKKAADAAAAQKTQSA